MKNHLLDLNNNLAFSLLPSQKIIHGPLFQQLIHVVQHCFCGHRSYCCCFYLLFSFPHFCLLCYMFIFAYFLAQFYTKISFSHRVTQLSIVHPVTSSSLFFSFKLCFQSVAVFGCCFSLLFLSFLYRRIYHLFHCPCLRTYEYTQDQRVVSESC